MVHCGTKALIPSDGPNLKASPEVRYRSGFSNPTLPQWLPKALPFIRRGPVIQTENGIPAVPTFLPHPRYELLPLCRRHR